MLSRPGAGGAVYFSLLKAMALSEIGVSKETETSGRLFGIAALVLVSVVTCPAHGTVVPVRALSWLNATTSSCPSSVSRR
ncbi:hypothetical protein H4582DRAFT_499554 [Lactarius indigo]|nr:hypothetical protein H4582DRAFT_499554 [Lactarius indigo]